MAGGLVSEYWGWEPLFVIDAATCTAAGFLVWWWFGARPVAPVEDDDDASAGKQSPWADPVFVALVGAVFLLALAFLQFCWHPLHSDCSLVNCWSPRSSCNPQFRSHDNPQSLIPEASQSLIPEQPTRQPKEILYDPLIYDLWVL